MSMLNIVENNSPIKKQGESSTKLPAKEEHDEIISGFKANPFMIEGKEVVLKNHPTKNKKKFLQETTHTPIIVANSAIAIAVAVGKSLSSTISIINSPRTDHFVFSESMDTASKENEKGFEKSPRITEKITEPMIITQRTQNSVGNR